MDAVAASHTVTWREITHDRLQEFVSRGHREKHVFPHRVLFLPKPGPDGYKLAGRMCGIEDPGRMWEIVLYAGESTLGEFPAELFFDDDLVWHQQQFGQPGHIAIANVAISEPVLWTFTHFADVVQRIGRRRTFKTSIEKRFRGWHDMLLNALLVFALERRIREIRIPTAALVMSHTDRNRTVEPELFERIYDRDVQRLFSARRAGDWWALDVEANRHRAVHPVVTMVSSRSARRTICVCHDVEAGLGHAGIDDGLARNAWQTWRQNLREMLAVERQLGVRTTYSIVGCLLDEVREEIAAGGHALAFHSYDHGEGEQLLACRRVDYRIKGYRPPQSRLTSELHNNLLVFHNFEWLASSARSLGTAEATFRDGLARIPIHFDDFHLYRDGLAFPAWEEAAFATIADHDVVVFSLHDCYANFWLDRYPDFLERVRTLGELRTLDELAASVTLAASA